MSRSFASKFCQKTTFFCKSYIGNMGESYFSSQSVSQTTEALFDDIPSDTFKQNVFASVVAEAVCNGKDRSEVANAIQFLQTLCCLLKNYIS